MKTKRMAAMMAAGCLCVSATTSWATQRLFTYTYEPETLPAGAAEFEQWITLRKEHNAAVGEDDFTRWDLREEFEYGVTDRYLVALYLNMKSESFEDVAAGTRESEFEFEGISVENKYLLLNPAEHAVGLAGYLEVSYAGEEAELEQKLIFGQRCGDWKWALNLVHATEWEDEFRETEGEIEVDFGLSRRLNDRWSIGVEFRNHNEIVEYETWEHTAFFFGPVINYRQENWWATLTVLPQIWGKQTGGGPDPDGDSGLVLDEHERVEVRLIFGIDL